MRNSDRGFTLIELLVVVSIVGILSSIAIAGFKEYKERSYTAIMQSAIQAGVTDVEAYIADGDYQINTSAVRRINADGTHYQNAFADIALPSARPGPNTYIWARIYPCAGEDIDRYMVQAYHWWASSRLRYDNRCGGQVVRTTYAKCPGKWSGAC